MRKTYVLDTNVLLQSPRALYSFEDNDLVIPLVVVEELDGLKKADGEKGSNARTAVRILESCRIRGDLLQGVELENGGTVRIEPNFVDVTLPEDLPDDKPDNRILKVCKGLSEKVEGQLILVTKDLVLRLKAQIIGLKAEDFTTEQITSKDAEYTGRCSLYIPDDMIKEFKKKGISADAVYQCDEDGNHVPFELFENEFVVLQSDQARKKTLLGRVKGDHIVPLVYKKSKPYGI